MMNYLLKLVNDLSEINNDKEKVLDITNDNDYKEFVNTVNELKNNETFDFVSSFFDIDGNKLCDEILEAVNNYRKENVKKEQPKKEEPKLIEQKIERPSSKINVNIGLQIHKLVQEYVDTMIKPYNPKNNGLSDSQINDAYAGLYEFACWIYNHK